MTQDGSMHGGFAIVITRIGALWILAGAVLKLLLGTPQDLPQLVQDLPLDLGLTFRVAIAAELAVGLLALLKPRWAWLLLLTLLLLFDVALVTQIRAGEPSCGCFGSSITVPPVVMLAVDSLLILLLLVSRPWSVLGRDGIHVLAIVMLLTLAVPLPWLLDREAQGDNGTVVVGRPWVPLEVETWPGRRLDATKLAKGIDLSTLPAEGIWILYRDTCELCAELLDYMRAAEIGERPVVLVKLPDTPGEDPKIHALPEGPHVHHATLSEGTDWLVVPPAGFVVRDGCVLWAKVSMGVEDHELTLTPPVPEGCREGAE